MPERLPLAVGIASTPPPLTPEQLAEISSDDESNSERDPFMKIGVLKKRKRRKRFGIF